MALASKPADVRIGEHLVNLGIITETTLYECLALQNNLQLGKPETESVSVPITRALPASVARKWQVLPYRIAAGETLYGKRQPAG